MTNFNIKPAAPIRQSASAPSNGHDEAASKKAGAFTRSAPVDGGRLSDFGHNLANGARRIFGRPEQPSGQQVQAALVRAQWVATPAGERVARWVAQSGPVQPNDPGERITHF